MEMITAVLLSLMAGAGLGIIFFLGLWKTVQRMSQVDRPYLWMFSSFIVRLIIVLLGFYLIMQIQWQMMAVALLGFIFARVAVIRYTIGKEKSADKPWS